MIVAVYGSPRRGGNTDLLMDAFLEPVSEQEEVRRFKLREIKLAPCTECGNCDKTGVCVFDDDIWNVYKTLNDARGLVLSSPIFFASVTAQLKMLIDRAQALWAAKYVLGQRAVFQPKGKSFFISAGAMKTDKYFLNAKLVVQSYVKVLDFVYSGDLFCPSVDRKGEVTAVDGALERAREEGATFLKQVQQTVG